GVKMRGYQTPNGLLNFVAIVNVTAKRSDGLFVTRYAFVNLPLQLDVPRVLKAPITIANRHGSRSIRTFAGDDVVYVVGRSTAASVIDGGLGTNTAVYSGDSENYALSMNADQSWKVVDNVGPDGADTLVRFQE